MSGKGCWLAIVAMFLAAAGFALWVRQEESRVIRLCVQAGGTWDYQATLCHF